MKRVILDTNIFVSMAMGGQVGKINDEWFEEHPVKNGNRLVKVNVRKLLSGVVSATASGVALHHLLTRRPPR